MPDYFLPTEEDRRILQEVIDAVKGGRLQLPPPLGRRRVWPESDDYMTPDVYVAKTPDGGIPGLTVGAGIGEDEDDEPGQATCDIYRIDASGTPTLSPISGPVSQLRKVVYNISPAAIGGAQWVEVKRTKYGKWIACWRNVLQWCKAQSDWTENGTYPNGDPKVSCKTCDRDGTNVTGDAFDVYLPRNPRPTVTNKLHDSDPYVFTDFVIGYMFDDESARICYTPYLHMGKIKDLKMIGNDGDTTWISPGFHDADGTDTSGLGGTKNAGDFILANFKRNYTLGDSPDNRDVGAFPRHYSNDEAVGAAACWAHLIDAIGQHGGTECTEVAHIFNHTPQGIPVGCEAQDDAGDAFAVEGGEYPAEIVLFIQRYK